MTTLSLVLWIAALISIVVFMYIVLPRISNRFPLAGDWLRIVIFFSMMIYFSWDFYHKQKYFMLILIVVASIAFIYAMRQKMVNKRK